MALTQAQIIASAKAAQAAQVPTEQMPVGTVLPTGAAAQALAAKSARPEQMKRLAVAGATGAIGFWLGGPLGAVLGAAGGYGYMLIKRYGLPGFTG